MLTTRKRAHWRWAGPVPWPRKVQTRLRSQVTEAATGTPPARAVQAERVAQRVDRRGIDQEPRAAYAAEHEELDEGADPRRRGEPAGGAEPSDEAEQQAFIPLTRDTWSRSNGPR